MTTTNDEEMTTLATDALARAEEEIAARRHYVATEFLRYYRRAVKLGGAQPTDGAARAAAVQSGIDRERRSAS